MATVQIIISFAIIGFHIAVILSVLLEERRQPSATLAWVWALILLPVFGVVLYLLIGTVRADRLVKRSRQTELRVRTLLDKHHLQTKLLESGAPPVEARTDAMLRLGDNVASTPASGGNKATMLVNATQAYRAMVEAIEAATDHIHVEFYIIQPDETGKRLRERLTRKAAEGVEVRVLVDGVGSYKLARKFWDPLIEQGGEARVFNPVSFFTGRFRRRRDRVDFRNHRKIVVCDGNVGFTGGINVGREYLGLDPEMGRWRDSHIQIDGPAVLSLQSAFIEDWLSATDELLDDPRYFPEPTVCEADQLVQIIDSGPDRQWSPVAYMFAHAMALSRQRIWLTSPYFVPDQVIENTLVGAALRGIDVRLLLPGKADHMIVDLAAKSYYRRLLDAGVRVFEYEKGFVHAKTMLVDDWVSTIGSTNIDMRSFHLNFELNAFVFGSEFGDEMADQFLADLDQAKEITPEILAKVNVLRRLSYAAARLLSPLL